MATKSFSLARCLALAVLSTSCATLDAAQPTPDESFDARSATADRFVACSPRSPVTYRGEAVTLRAWVGPKNDRVASGGKSEGEPPLEFVWSGEAGKIAGDGPEAQWTFVDEEPGYYAANVEVTLGERLLPACTLRIRLLEGTKGSPPGRTTRRSFLACDDDGGETKGYGLYSYLLLGSRPTTDPVRERYLAAIDAYLDLIEAVEWFQDELPTGSRNVTYLPLAAATPEERRPASEWVLENYNFTCAQELLRLLGGPHRGGPYLLSSAVRLLEQTEAPEPYLWQDLSLVQPRLVDLWVREFLNQTEQHDWWAPRRLAAIGLSLRLVIGIAGEAIPDIQESLLEWIRWFGQTQPSAPRQD